MFCLSMKSTLIEYTICLKLSITPRLVKTVHPCIENNLPNQSSYTFQTILYLILPYFISTVECANIFMNALNIITKSLLFMSVQDF